ncbi:hypothetical protein SDC9_69258 [bioreactor metagenome]|uniref:Uncharacterized protein n=1 Tax=bioreactor metagenome TaxID=1076179 RepID=A0A644Y2N4_9ZZZZ
MSLYRNFFFNCQFSSVVPALTTNSVIDMPCSAIRADGHSWHFGMVVRSSFSLSCRRLSSFWMCHFVYLFINVYILSYSKFNPFRPSHLGSMFSVISSSSANSVSSSGISPPSSSSSLLTARCLRSLVDMVLLHLPGS